MHSQHVHGQRIVLVEDAHTMALAAGTAGENTW